MIFYIWRLEFINPQEGTYEYVVPNEFKIVDLRGTVTRDAHPAVTIDRSYLDGPLAGVAVPIVNVGYKVLVGQMASAGRALMLVCSQKLTGLLVLEVVYELPGIKTDQHNRLDTNVFDYPLKIQVGAGKGSPEGKGFHLAPNMEWIDGTFSYEHLGGKGVYDKALVQRGYPDINNKLGFSGWVETAETGRRATYFKMLMQNHKVPNPVVLDCSFRFRMGNQRAWWPT